MPSQLTSILFFEEKAEEGLKKLILSLKSCFSPHRDGKTTWSYFTLKMIAFLNLDVGP